MTVLYMHCGVPAFRTGSCTTSDRLELRVSGLLMQGVDEVVSLCNVSGSFRSGHS